MATSAQNRDFVQALLPSYPLDEAIHFIQQNLSPEDVFEEKALEDWAFNNGYIKAD